MLFRRAVSLLALLVAASVVHAQWVDSAVNDSRNQSWNSVEYGDGAFVAVNGWGDIARSTDGGFTFNEVADFSSAGVNFNDLAYGLNGSGQTAFWATGNFGSTDFLYESLDGGVTWNDITSNFSFFASQGGGEIAVSATGHLVYTRLGFGSNDAFLFDGTYFSYGLGPEPGLQTSTDGETFSAGTNVSDEWVIGALTINGQLLGYGVGFGTPGDFSTRYGALFDLSSDGANFINPRIIVPGSTGYISDIDYGIEDDVLYAAGGNTLATSFDAGVTWTADVVDPSAVSNRDYGELAVGPNTRVVVGSVGIMVIPEPGVVALFASGLVVLLLLRRRR